MPLIRRLPKRGFTNIFRKETGIVNLEQLSELASGTEVTLLLAKEKGWVSNRAELLKILGNGEMKHPLVIRADKISKAADEKVKKAGGTVEVVRSKL